MSQDRTDAGQRCTLTEHGSGGGVPQDVSTVDGRFDSRSKQCAPHDVGDSRTCQGVKRSQNGSEHLGHVQRWPALIQIKQNRVADLLREWQRFLPTPFPQTVILPFRQSMSANLS